MVCIRPSKEVRINLMCSIVVRMVYVRYNNYSQMNDVTEL
jgi:hypothetical protein